MNGEDNYMLTRKSSRAIVINKHNQIFLFRYTFDFFADSEEVWITPGGGLDEGETFEEALERELFEELGIKLTESAPEIFYRIPLYVLKDGKKYEARSGSIWYVWMKQNFLMRAGQKARRKG